MINYELSDKYIVFGKTTSKGTQKKYFIDSYYYKVNKSGNEGFVEYLVSRILHFSTLPVDSYVYYEFCKINNELGCRSKNFLSSTEEFLTINTLWRNYTGMSNLSEELFSLRDAKTRLDYILNFIQSMDIDSYLFRDYLETILQLDMLILNSDRHFHNFGIIRDVKSKCIRMAPIFDNGLSLCTNRDVNPNSCTISGSFEEQVTAWGYPIKAKFKIDYDLLSKDLIEIEKIYGNKYELTVLRNQLKRYKSLFSI